MIIRMGKMRSWHILDRNVLAYLLHPEHEFLNLIRKIEQFLDISLNGDFDDQASDGEVEETKTSYCGDPVCNEPIVNLRSCMGYTMTLTAFQVCAGPMNELVISRESVLTGFEVFWGWAMNHGP